MERTFKLHLRSLLFLLFMICMQYCGSYQDESFSGVFEIEKSPE